MIILGITGGSGCGKTTVSDYFRNNGIDVIDTDKVARLIVEPGQPALSEIKSIFGDEYISADGTLNRKKLGNYVFSHPDKISILNKITHKYISRYVDSYINSYNGEIIGIDGAALIESGIKPETLLKFTATPHTIILVETKFSTATTAAKQLAKAIQVREFKLPAPNTRVVFDILNTARRNGPQAVQLLDKIITTQEPQQFLGLLASQAVKAFAGQPTPKNQRILKSLAQLDLDLKSSGLAAEPWLLIKGWLLRVASL